MAINFPATGGQATDGSFTYTVAGITYAWNGSSWAAAGAGASATNRSLFSVATNSPSGGGSLVYSTTNGAFTYTPPNLSGFLTAETDTLATVTGRNATTSNSIALTGGLTLNTLSFSTTTGSQLNSSGLIIASSTGFAVNNTGNTATVAEFSFASGCILKDNGNNTRLSTLSTGVTINGALTAGGLTYPTTNGNPGQSLVSDGAGNVTWQTAAGLSSRATVSNTSSLANDAVANVSLTAPKTFVLLKVETSHAAWVTLYSDTASRTADASRQISVDPIPGSGVLAEVITTGSQTQLITPGAICFNSAGTGTVYAKIVNKSGSTSNVQVTLTYVALEA